MIIYCVIPFPPQVGTLCVCKTPFSFLKESLTALAFAKESKLVSGFQDPSISASSTGIKAGMLTPAFHYVASGDLNSVLHACK